MGATADGTRPRPNGMALDASVTVGAVLISLLSRKRSSWRSPRLRVAVRSCDRRQSREPFESYKEREAAAAGATASGMATALPPLFLESESISVGANSVQYLPA